MKSIINKTDQFLISYALYYNEIVKLLGEEYHMNHEDEDSGRSRSWFHIRRTTINIGDL